MVSANLLAKKDPAQNPANGFACRALLSGMFLRPSLRCPLLAFLYKLFLTFGTGDTDFSFPFGNPDLLGTLGTSKMPVSFSVLQYLRFSGQPPLNGGHPAKKTLVFTVTAANIFGHHPVDTIKKQPHRYKIERKPAGKLSQQQQQNGNKTYRLVETVVAIPSIHQFLKPVYHNFTSLLTSALLCREVSLHLSVKLYHRFMNRV